MRFTWDTIGIKVCLFDSREVSLRDLMRNGASDETLVKVSLVNTDINYFEINVTSLGRPCCLGLEERKT